MGKAGKLVGAAIAATTSFFGAVTDLSDLSRTRSYGEQQSSHYEQRADRRERRRTDTLKSGTRSAGNRKRGSGQRSEKPARLDHRYNG